MSDEEAGIEEATAYESASIRMERMLYAVGAAMAEVDRTPLTEREFHLVKAILMAVATEIEVVGF